MELMLELRSLYTVLQSPIYFSITRKVTAKRTGLAPATTTLFFFFFYNKYNAITRNPPKAELEDTTKL